MLLDRSPSLKPQNQDARLVIGGTVARDGTIKQIRELFYEEAKRHGADIIMYVKDKDGQYKSVLRRTRNATN